MGTKIIPILTGYCTSNPKTYHYHYSTHKYRPNLVDHDIPLPVFAFLVDTGNEVILIDTGMADTERANKYHHPGSTQDPDQAIDVAVEKLGYKCEDVSKIIFTHLHWDHTYHMKKFVNAKYYAQRKEYEFAIDPIPLYYKSYESKHLGIEPAFEGCKFELLDGEAEIQPGIRVYPTPGHSVGHQCVEVDTDEGTYHMVGDAIIFLDHLTPIPEIMYDVTPIGRFVDIVSWWNSARTIKERAKNLDMILPTHDPLLVERVKTKPIYG